jgi:hypothetical protein
MAEMAANPPTVERDYLAYDPNGTYMYAGTPSPFQWDYDKEFWHYQSDPNEKNYPNIYTNWRAIPEVDTSLRNTGAALGAIFLVAAAGVALHAGHPDVAADCVAAAIDVAKEVKSEGFVWDPYYYAPRKGMDVVWSELGDVNISEYPEGPSGKYTKERFQQFPQARNHASDLPPGARIVVYEGVEDFLDPKNGDPYDVRAYAYPPFFAPDESRVLEDMAEYPSFIVLPDGTLGQVNY